MRIAVVVTVIIIFKKFEDLLWRGLDEGFEECLIGCEQGWLRITRLAFRRRRQCVHDQIQDVCKY